MKKIMFVVVTLLSVAFVQSCRKVSGDGPIITRSYPLSGFSSIDSKLNADVYYTQDSFYKVEVEGQSNIIDIMDLRVTNGSLMLQFDKYKNVRRYERLTVHVTAPNLSSLSLHGSGNVRIPQPVTVNSNISLSINGSGNIDATSITASSLEAEITGSGNIRVGGGSANYEEAEIDGSGNIDLLGVMAKSVKVETSGSGKTIVWATDNLDVKISGSGDVFYKGNPSIRLQTSGSGKVSNL